VNVCGPAKKLCNSNFPNSNSTFLDQAYPALSDADGLCYPLGTSKFIVELLESGNPQKGAKISYQDGSVGGIPSVTIVETVCDGSVLTPRFEYVSNRYENGLFIVTFRITSKAACPGMGGAAYYGYYPPLWPVGFGGLFAILASVAFVVYCIVGVLVNKFKWKMEGLLIIPNWPFWSVLPFLFKDGIVFTFNGFKTLFLMIKAKIKGEGYQEV
jgi:hypothetical protein